MPLNKETKPNQTEYMSVYVCVCTDTSGGVMVCKLDQQAYISEFDSH